MFIKKYAIKIGDGCMEKRNTNMIHELDSLLVSLYISIPAINAIICAVFPSLSGRLMTILYLGVGTVIVIRPVTRKQNRRISYQQVVLLFLLLLFLVGTILITPYSTIKITKFLPLTLIPYLIPISMNIDGKKMLEYLMTIPIFGVLFINKVFYVVGFKYESVTMGISYAFLPCVVAAIVFWRYYADEYKGNIWIIAVTIVDLVYAYELIKFGSRGPLLSILLCIAYALIFNNRESGGIAIPRKRIAIVMFVIIIIIYNGQSLASLLNTFLEKHDIYINALDKFSRLHDKTGDVTNGRTEIWKLAIHGFIESPIWGNGLCTSKNNYGYIYPHNFILQFLYDGGVILFLPFVISFYKGFIDWFKNCSMNQFVIGTSMLIMSFPGAMLSGDLWENPRLWIAISYFIFLAYSKETVASINNTSEMNNENTICRC